MSEDIFSQFFNLFNNDEEDVNWELAKQINTDGIQFFNIIDDKTII